LNETYEFEMCKGHNRANKDGYVYTHILVAEEILGRPLTDEECVHHIDENRKNNNPDNLMVFRSNSDHISYHRGLPCKCINGVYQVDEDLIIKKTCLYCGCIFYGDKRNKFCSIECSSMNQRKVARPDISTLLNEVNESSYKAVGRKYGVSDNTIRKWIKNMRQ